MNNCIKPGLCIPKRFGMAVNIKMIILNGIKHHLRHLGRTYLATADGFVTHGLTYQLAGRWLGGWEVIGSVALALVDARRNEIGTKNTGADLFADQFQILVKGFG